MTFLRRVHSTIARGLGRRTTQFYFFLCATVIIIAPFLSRVGYLFFLDTISVPNDPFPRIMTNPGFLADVLWWFLGNIPFGFGGKLYIGTVFMFLGLGMFRLIQRILPFRNIAWACYFGGILYMFNPFVYSRILVGHLSLIAALSFIPWFFYDFLESLSNTSLYTALRIALWWTLITILNLHLGVFLIIFLLLDIIGRSIFNFFHRREKIFILGRWYFFLLLFFFLLNSYWIIPVLTGTSAIGELIGNRINNTDIFSFFTRTDSQHGILWNTASLYGFWGDDDMRYVSQKLFVSHWFYIFFVLFLLVLWGVGVSVRRCFWRKKGTDTTFLPEANIQNDEREKRFIGIEGQDFFRWWVVVPLILTGFIAFFLAVGVSYEPFKPAILWLYNHVPFFRGFREPQKFVALLVFVYAIFSSIGVDDILQSIEGLRSKKLRFLKIIAPAFFLLIPLAYSPGMLWGFHGQIKPSNYPESWFAVDQFLVNDKDNFQVLFLPWHQYIYLGFARTVIANPAERFFHKPTIAGDNMEFGPIYTESTRPESKYIEQKIIQRRKDFITEKGNGVISLGQTLLPLNIKYIIMAKDSDFIKYSFVPNSPDMKLVYDSSELSVYQNLVFGLR